MTRPARRQGEEISASSRETIVGPRHEKVNTASTEAAYLRKDDGDTHTIYSVTTVKPATDTKSFIPTSPLQEYIREQQQNFVCKEEAGGKICVNMASEQAAPPVPYTRLKEITENVSDSILNPVCRLPGLEHSSNRFHHRHARLLCPESRRIRTPTPSPGTPPSSTASWAHWSTKPPNNPPDPALLSHSSSTWSTAPSSSTPPVHHRTTPKKQRVAEACTQRAERTGTMRRTACGVTSIPVQKAKAWTW